MYRRMRGILARSLPAGKRESPVPASPMHYYGPARETPDSGDDYESRVVAITILWAVLALPNGSRAQRQASTEGAIGMAGA